MQKPSFKTRGLSIVEFLIYIAVLVVVVTVVTASFIGLGRAYAKAKAIRAVNQVGVHVMDRIAREVRQSTSMSASSVGGVTTITLNGIPTTYAEAVRKDGAMSHWDFEEKDGDLIDRVGNIDGTVIHINGRNEQAVVGKGYHFDPQVYNDGRIDLGEGQYDHLTEGAIEMIIQPHDIGQTLNAVFALIDPSRAQGDRVWGVGSMGNIDPTQFGAMGYESVGDYIGYSPANGLGALSSTKYYPRGDFYHVVVEATHDIGSKVYVNGNLVGSASQDHWFDSSTMAGWRKSYQIGNAPYEGSYVSFGFDGIIDELAIYPEPKSESVWAEHYRTAFPTVNGGGATVAKILTISGNKIKLQDGDGSEIPLASDAITEITDVTATALGTDGSAGLRLQFTVKAGSGSAASSATFQTIIAPRPQ